MEKSMPVQYSNWTDDRFLRHPSFQGLRDDKPAASIGREIANERRTNRSTSSVPPWCNP